MPTKYEPTLKHKPHSTVGRSVGQYKRRKHTKTYDLPKPVVIAKPAYTPPSDEELERLFDALFADGVLK